MPGIMERWKLFKHPAIVNVTVSGDASTQVLNYTAKERRTIFKPWSIICRTASRSSL